jgi:hypothetical protein
MADAEKAWDDAPLSIWSSPFECFMAGRASRDAEVAEVTRLLGESRARYGDIEARLVEAEAVIAAAKTHLSGEVPRWDEWWAWTKKAITILAASPSVVLADHDKEVAAQAWDEGAEDGAWNSEHAAMIERGTRSAISNPYRVADQNGGE